MADKQLVTKQGGEAQSARKRVIRLWPNSETDRREERGKDECFSELRNVGRPPKKPHDSSWR